MKKTILLLLLILPWRFLKAQSFEIEQLALDIQKLTALKSILSDLYKGYEILNQGYSEIKDISEGNFNLHKVFLDRLLRVSPQVQNYVHVADIIDNQVNLVSEYKTAYSQFQQDKHFTTAEIKYLALVYGNIFDQSLADLNNLINLITAETLRMSDEERLQAIDGIYEESKNKLMFLRAFNAGTRVLLVQKAGQQNDAGTLENLY
jgi:hypothetical protein